LPSQYKSKRQPSSQQGQAHNKVNEATHGDNNFERIERAEEALVVLSTLPQSTRGTAIDFDIAIPFSSAVILM
jgi:hypothetical protein